MNAYAQLLASGRVRRLVATSFVARLPTAMLPLAILLLVVEAGGTIGAAGLCAGAFGLGRAAISPSVGALIDRVGQPRVLTAGSVLQALLLVALVAASRAHALIAGVAVLAFVAGAASPPVQASLRALWPRVTAPDSRDSAYSFDATSQELIWIVGPLCVAAILPVATAAAAVIAAGVAGCVGVVLFATSEASRTAPRSATGRLIPRALAAPGLQAMVGISICGGFAWGAQTVGLSALAVQLQQRQSAGVLLAVLSAGSIAGGLIYGGRTWRGDPVRRQGLLLVAAGGLSAPLLFTGSIPTAVVAALVAGLPLAPLWAASYAITGRVAPRDAVTEAFTWTSSAFALGVSLGTAAGGVAAQSAGVRAAFALACLAPLAGWFLTPFIRDRGALAEAAQTG
ncbi:MAG: MFS transporter [Acidobacteria bacterium]|nr:MFS transporter [Acidobacteriota bacterium]